MNNYILGLGGARRRWPVIALALAAGVCVESARSATYYVDFAAGSDANSGLSTNAPWKHCPGDANATATPGVANPAPGDAFLFKGGVRYRGTIVIKTSGSAGSPITYKGDGWGQERAIIDGSELMNVAWTRCTNASDCRGNTNWAAIWQAPAPTNVVSGGMNPFTLLSLGDKALPFAQEPNPADPLYWSNVSSEWYPINPANVTTSTLVDHLVFTNADSGYYTGSYVAVWVYGNEIKIMPITSFVPAENKIGFSMGSSTPYPASTSYFAILGHVRSIDTPGEYALRTNENRIYYWPVSNANPNTQSLYLGARPAGIFGLSRHDLVIDGFRITGVNGSINGIWDDGVGIFLVGNSMSDTMSNNIVRNCEVFNIRSPASMAGIDCRFMTSLVISNNSVHDNSMAAKGITVAGLNIIVSSNVVNRILGTGIYFAGVREGLMHGNRISGIHGIHANGLSVYQDSTNVEVSANYLQDAGSQIITYEHSHNILFMNNVADSSGADGRINEWSGMSGTVRFFNNTFVRNSNHSMMSVGVSSNATYEMRNNIIDGCSSVISNRSNNIYVGLFWNQSSAYGWSLGPGESLYMDYQLVFGSSSTGDFHLLQGSLASGAGTNLFAQGVTSDMDGTPRPSSGAWDIGAYEMVATTVPPVVLLTAPTNGASYSSPATIALTASVTSNAHAIAKIQFYNGAALLAEDTTAPYGFTWSSVTGGSYTLKAIAVYDTSNAVSSALAVVAVTNPPPVLPPAVLLTVPTDGASFTAPATISMTANVTANGHTIAKVQFYDGASLLGEKSSAPYDFAWNNVGIGNYTLRARTIYDVSDSVDSAAAVVTVGSAPVPRPPAHVHVMK